MRRFSTIFDADICVVCRIVIFTVSAVHSSYVVCLPEVVLNSNWRRMAYECAGMIVRLHRWWRRSTVHASGHRFNVCLSWGRFKKTRFRSSSVTKIQSSCLRCPFYLEVDQPRVTFITSSMFLIRKEIKLSSAQHHLFYK